MKLIFKCKKPLLITVVLKVLEISLKSQFIIVILQFSLKPLLISVVSKLFLIYARFNSIVILILFLKYSLS